MRKIITMLTALLLFTSYKSYAKEVIKENNNMEKRVLVAYFSYSGTTKRYAEKIAHMVGNADLFQIQAAQPYTSEDVDWTNASSRVNKEMKENPNSRPKMTRKIENLKDYDVVFLGFPIWWHIAPNIINTFLETQDFKGKTIIPFFTSHSSGPGETDKHLRKSIPYKVEWKPATRVNRMSDKELKEWISRNLQ